MITEHHTTLFASTFGECHSVVDTKRLAGALLDARMNLVPLLTSFDRAQARKREAEIKVERYTGMNTKGRA